ncbi:MAG: hypothetical protein FWG52_09895 [Proteobacteria bacterium]|nr:hypothetical protein [Pseudomonadota bacterium]
MLLPKKTLKAASLLGFREIFKIMLQILLFFFVHLKILEASSVVRHASASFHANEARRRGGESTARAGFAAVVMDLVMVDGHTPAITAAWRKKSGEPPHLLAIAACYLRPTNRNMDLSLCTKQAPATK